MTESQSYDARKQNEDAVLALVTMLGGSAGMIADRIKLADLAPILDADPDDDLSGLRLIAERMSGAPYRESEPDEGREIIWPEEARHWLLTHDRAIEVNGELQVLPAMDHMGWAALRIANSDGPESLIQAYREVTDNRAPLSNSIIRDLAKRIANGYEDSKEQDDA